ncbi:hypothetical protein D3C77_443690 [compost metagenome]
MGEVEPLPQACPLGYPHDNKHACNLRLPLFLEAYRSQRWAWHPQASFSAYPVNTAWQYTVSGLQPALPKTPVNTTASEIYFL